ncbi:hypothetical protein O3P69_005380 [Scylla paramamosain]|uniref:Aminopeptidase n=1 Tax=Scylla paramamosain TaxID=85552 RepID=A0AAW0U9U6_SCYPA
MEDERKPEEPPMEIFATNSSQDVCSVASEGEAKKKKKKKKSDNIRMGLAVSGFVVSIAIIVLGFFLGAEAKKHKTTESNPSFRLPKTLQPTEYQVRLQPFVNGNYSIAGHVQVEMLVVQATSNITIHLADIVTHNETIQVRRYKAGVDKEGEQGEEVVVSSHEYDQVKEWYVAHLARELQVNDTVILSMSFTGLLNDQLKGFYRSTYTLPNGETVRLAVTFFSPINARRAFPCLDEPAMKARFKVSLARQTNMTARANMPLEATEPIPDQKGWVWDHFQTTLPMSTYLVAFLVSDFTSKSNGNVSVWSREAVLGEAEHALQIGPELIAFFEDYLNVTFPLPKMDLVALPDFAAGAMENWGLTTFREGTMLLPNRSSAGSLDRVETIMAHELAHQWFGNLVTAAWWEDILLKEGMASFMENIATEALRPTWGILDQMLLTVQGIMVSDALPSTHPVNQPVAKPSDIGQVFDTITYSKGMSVIRMMSHFLTEDTFRRGLIHYLNQYAYGSATQDDFWAVLTKVAREDGRLPASVTVKDVMDTWTRQSGYPVVTVARSEDGHTATLTQERFLLSGNITQEEKYQWWVPLSFTSANASNFTTEPALWMKNTEASVVLESLPGKEAWILFNLQGTGYFRVNYDKANWAAVTAQLLTDHEAIEMVSRAQLLDDALSLARGGRLSYETALGLNAYLAAETDYLPWTSALTALSYLEKMLTRTASYGYLRRYLLNLLEPLYASVGFEDDLSNPHLEQHKRSLAVAWACKLDHKQCVSKAVQYFGSWMTNDTEVSPNIKSTVYCTGVAKGGVEAWEGVWARYLETEVAREKLHLLQALGCSKEIWILSRYLDMAFTEGSGIRKQDINLVFSSVAENDVGRSLAWNFLRSNWEMIVSYYDTFSSAASLLISATAEFNTPIEMRELEVFVQDNAESLKTSSRAVKTALENADGNVAWMEKYYQVIKDWLQENAKTRELAKVMELKEKAKEKQMV